MFQLLQSLSFQNIALPFQILLFFQTTDLLPHIFSVSIHRLAHVTFVEATCDNLEDIKKNRIIHKKSAQFKESKQWFHLELNSFPRSMLFQGDLPLKTPY